MSITRTLLASDLDGTLIPLDRDAHHLQGVEEFVRAVNAAPGLGLAYVTGRHLALAEDGIAEVGLPLPDWFVCDVGTSVYRRTDSRFALDSAYQAEMKEALGGLSSDDVRAALGGIDGLALQEAEKQADFKLSYYTRGRHEPYVPPVERALAEAGARCSVIASYDPLTHRGLLDVLPAGVAKDYAVCYLQRETGLDPDHLVYAGDSGNDRAAMLAGFRAIVVGNADRVLKDELAVAAATSDLVDQLYFAEQPYARGVLEGLRHFDVVK
jgi:HAD superfamily hydrolase (TIGR01484 family)